jgi:hypothetical protein
MSFPEYAVLYQLPKHRKSGISDKDWGDMDNLSGSAEIGILAYEGSQAAAVLGMTDILTSAVEIFRRRQGGDNVPLVVSHWLGGANGDKAERTFLSRAAQDTGHPTVIVIPPGFGDPMSKADARCHVDGFARGTRKARPFVRFAKARSCWVRQASSTDEP